MTERSNNDRQRIGTARSMLARARSPLARMSMELLVDDLEAARRDAPAEPRPASLADFYLTDGPVSGLPYGADAEVVGQAVTLTARFLKARSRQRVGTRSKPAKKGTSTPPLRAFQPVFTTTLHGSFGFRLEDATMGGGEGVDVGAIEDFQKILHGVSGVGEEFEEAIGVLNRNARAALRELLKVLTRSNAGFRMEVPDSAAGTQRLDREAVRETYLRITSASEAATVVSLRGVVKGILPSPVRKYQFIAAEDMAQSRTTAKVTIGPVDPGIDDGDIALIQDLYGVSSNAFFRLVKVDREQGAPREVWTLIGIRRDSDGKLIGQSTDDDAADEGDENDEP